MKNVYSTMKVTIGVFLILTGSISIIIPIAAHEQCTNQSIPVYILETEANDVTHQYISLQEAKNLLAIVFEQKEKPSFSSSLLTILDMISEFELLSVDTVSDLEQKLGGYQKLRRDFPISESTGRFFDLFNFFNGIGFGLKGERLFKDLDLPVYKFPFFNTNITALFSIYTKFAGSGFIFTLGTLGFQYLYEFDMDSYTFPHFPQISGILLGFTGVLLKIIIKEDFGEEYAGTYFIGIGMTIVSAWNTLDQ